MYEILPLTLRLTTHVAATAEQPALGARTSRSLRAGARDAGVTASAYETPGPDGARFSTERSRCTAFPRIAWRGLWLRPDDPRHT